MGEPSDLILWNRIQSFELDKADTALPFSARLARENSWNPAFALRVCGEYKKFIYLACISSDIVTPSADVDEAWHLHLAYTRSYWQDFCRDTLRRELHHTPTDGGPEEDEKFRAAYERTLARYKQEFREEPPNDIWPPVEQRFSRPSRITSATHYIVWKQHANLTMVGAAAVAGAGVAMYLGAHPAIAAFAAFMGFMFVGSMAAPSIIKTSKGSGGGCGSGCGSGCGGGCG